MFRRLVTVIIILIYLMFNAPTSSAGETAGTVGDTEEDSTVTVAFELALSRLEIMNEKAKAMKEAGKIDEALAELNRIVEFEPAPFLPDSKKRELYRETVHACLEMTDILLDEKKDPDRALSVLEAGKNRLKKLEPSSPETVQLKLTIAKKLAAVYRVKKDFDRALRVLEDAEKENINHGFSGGVK